MSGRKLIADELWHCLCPRYAKPQLSVSGRKRYSTAAAQAIPQIPTPSVNPSIDTYRSSTLRTRTPASSHTFRRETDVRTPISQRVVSEKRPTTIIRKLNESATSKRPSKPEKDPLRDLFGETTVVRLPTGLLYEGLRKCAVSGHVDAVRRLVEVLVVERNESPNTRLYSALILVNVHRDSGSAAGVGSILQEMRHEGIVLDNSLYHDVLRVLAIHPDPVLLGQVRAEMAERWLQPTIAGWHNIVVCNIKGSQMELALEDLQTMASEGIPSQDWLYDMAIYALCDMKEVEEVGRLMKYRLSAGHPEVSASLWYYVFDLACHTLHYDTLKFIWKRRVEPLYLIPTIGQCTSVLNAAAREGDIALATEVFRVLGNRDMAFESIHYELLIEAHLSVDELDTALTIFCIMNSSGTIPNERSTRVLWKYLTFDEKRIQEALRAMKHLQSQGRNVPVSIYNCLLEATVEILDVNIAIGQYKDLRKVCPGGPNVHTFNALFKGCRKDKQTHTAMFLASEMVAMGIVPQQLTYDRLLLVCLEGRDADSACRYFYEMIESGMTPRGGTIKQLVKKCAMIGDERVWDILKKAESLGEDVATLQRVAESSWEETKRTM